MDTVTDGYMYEAAAVPWVYELGVYSMTWHINCGSDYESSMKVRAGQLGPCVRNVEACENGMVRKK